MPMHKIIALTMATGVDVAKAQRCIKESFVDIYRLTRQQKKVFFSPTSLSSSVIGIVHAMIKFFSLTII